MTMMSNLNPLKSTALSAVLLGITGSISGGCTVATEGSELNSARQDAFGDRNGIQGTAFVHLFEWRWNDIADECENFLGPKGFAAVQVSPPNEHINYGAWWARYQPVSYKIESRSGTREEFRQMVERCDAVGVSIVADLIINHTATRADDGPGVAGTEWSVSHHPMYSPQDYHPECMINNYADADNVQNCQLNRLPDLNTGSPYVQDQIAGYINDLQDLGVKGFRIDAAKHIHPADIQAILTKAGNPEVLLEVIGSAGEAVQPSWYAHLGRITEFDYSRHIGHRFRRGQIYDLNRIADGKLATDRAVVFTDNHDNQRGHGASGETTTFEDGSTYNLANAFMLAWPYGYPRVMSSYQFHGDTDAGPPAGGTNCANPEFVCEHRWTTIANMVRFRNVTDGQAVANWWTDGNNRIAFSRGDKGFIAINKEGGAMSETLQTGMPAGEYCNIAGGDFLGADCTGNRVTVDAAGFAQISVAAMEAVAIHAESRLGSGPSDPADPTHPPPTGPSPAADSVVDFTCYNGNTYVGQSVYVVGSTPELGNWDPAQAVRLEPSDYPTWTGSVPLAANRVVEWKCIKRDEANPGTGLDWQPGANNTVQTPASGRTSSAGSL